MHQERVAGTDVVDLLLVRKQAVVRPEERTAASGATSLVRLAGWAVAPAIAGPLMEGVSLAIPLVVAAALKITYDVLLWVSFRRVAPPEEVAARGGAA